MSLVDSIYEAGKESEETKSLIETLVDKAVENSVENCPSQYSIYQLYRRGKEIWYGHEQVEETQQNVYVLTGYEERIPQPLLFLFWPRLKERLPVLNTNYMRISNNLIWDKINGEIINLKEEKK